MMTRREVLEQLKRVGVKDLSLLKRSCRDFENYMAVNYDYEILKKGRIVGLPALPLKNPTLSSLKISLNLKRRSVTYPRLGFRASKGNLEQNRDHSVRQLRKDVSNSGKDFFRG